MTAAPVVAIIAAGAMGAAVGQRLTEHGVEVRTSLFDRSEASVARSKAAGMLPVDDAGIAQADVLLSIVPPGDALALAQRMAPVLARGNPRLLYVDCNAVSPQSVLRIEAVVASCGVRFVDAGIIGGPPMPGKPGPVFYASGPDAAGLTVLAEHGLELKLLDGPIGAASGLKMSYAGITKGVTALASAMALAATRFGCAADLRAELAQSQPNLLAQLQRSVPDMFPKAYRWVAEMEEIAAFAGDDAAAQDIYQGIARLYQALADDEAADKVETGRLAAFFGP